MKKYFSYLPLFLAVVIGSLCFVSCGNDDEETPGGPADGGASSEALVGTWMNQYVDNNGPEPEVRISYVTFCANGTFYSFEPCEEHDMDVYKGAYSYDASAKTLTVKMSDDKSASTGKIEINGNKATLTDLDGDTREYTKIQQSPVLVSELERIWQEQEKQRREGNW